jgi:hypothetical protein
MFAVVVLGLLILANFSFGLLSSVRAYASAESAWSKSQKDAIFQLQEYGASRDPEELREFRAAIAVPLGDRDARIEMDKPKPDFDKARQGFIRGGVHPDDIDGMINLYRRFAWVSFMQRAIRAWDAGDRYVVQLDNAGTLLQREIESPARTPGRSKPYWPGSWRSTKSSPPSKTNSSTPWGMRPARPTGHSRESCLPWPPDFCCWQSCCHCAYSNKGSAPRIGSSTSPFMTI